MPFKSNGRCQTCYECVRSIYLETGRPATVAQIAERIGGSIAAVGDLVSNMARKKRIVLFGTGAVGQTRFILPRDVLIPPGIIKAGKREFGDVADYPDEFILMRLTYFMQEFYRRGISMKTLEEYVTGQSTRAR